MGAVGKEARKALLEYLEVNLKYGENVFFIEKMLSAFSQLIFALYVLIGNDSHLAKENQTIQSKPNKTLTLSSFNQLTYYRNKRFALPWAILLNQIIPKCIEMIEIIFYNFCKNHVNS